MLRNAALSLTLMSAILPGKAQTWEQFAPTGSYAIQYVGDNPDSYGRYLSNPLSRGGQDWDVPAMLTDYARISCAWFLTDRGDGDITVQNTRAGANAGDYIMKDSKIRLASTIDIVNYRANQTFKFYHDSETDTDSPTVAIMSNAVADRFWELSANSLSYGKNTPEGAGVFKLIPLYHHHEMEQLEPQIAVALADTDHAYGASERATLESLLPQMQTMLASAGYSKTEADELWRNLNDAYDAFCASARVITENDLSSLSPEELAAKTMLAMQGDVSDEDFTIIRSSMIRLRELDLSESTITALPKLALAGLSSLETVKLPRTLASIGDGAFAGCVALKELQLPEALTTIGDMAFTRTALTNLVIGPQVTAIGQYALAQCPALARIDVADGNATYKSIDGMLFDYQLTQLLRCPPQLPASAFSLPETIKTIGDYACADCTLLENELNLPSSLETIGNYAFANCTGLSGELKLPASLRAIGRNAFFGCTGFTGTLTLPSAAPTTRTASFAYLTGIESITLPESTTRLGESLFECCNAVETIRCDAPNPPAAGNFTMRAIDRTDTYVSVPASALSDYRSAPLWSEFQNYEAPISQYFSRFSTNGKYIIRYIPSGEDNLCLAYSTYGAPAELMDREDATLWNLDFFEPTSTSLPFGSGPASDILYTDATTVYHINMQGLSFSDDKEGYERRDNRTFAFWIRTDADEGSNPVVAIQSNGYIWKASDTQLIAESYAARRPRSSDFIWELIDPDNDKSAIAEVPIAEPSSERRLFDISGRPVAPHQITPGIYIELRNGKTRKIIL